MDNIEEMLRALVDEDGDEEQCCRECGECSSENDDNGLLSGLDPEMLLKLMGLMETLNRPDDSERFLLALKPLLRAENRVKVDSAMRLVKLFSLIPVLKDAGLLDKLI